MCSPPQPGPMATQTSSQAPIEAFDQQLEILGALRDEIEGVPSE